MTAHAHNEAQWQSQVLWRYRALALALVGLLAVGFGVLGVTQVATSVHNAQVYQRAKTLASLSFAVTGLAAHLQDERDLTMQYIGQGLHGRLGTLDGSMGIASQNLSLVQQVQRLTDPWVRKVLADSAAVGAGYQAQVQQDAADVVALLKLLDPRRVAATSTALPAVDVMSSYTSMIDGLLSLDHNIALGSDDVVLSGDVASLNLVSLIGEETSEQRGLLANALAAQGHFDPTTLSDLLTVQVQQEANVAEFDRVATPQQVALYNDTVQGSLVSFATSYEQQAIATGQANGTLNKLAPTANDWYGAMSTGTIGSIRAVEQDLVTATIARASALRRNATVATSVIGAALVIALVLALLLMALVGLGVIDQRRAPSLRTTALG